MSKRRPRHPEAARAAYCKPLLPLKEKWLVILRRKDGERVVKRATSYSEARSRAMDFLGNPFEKAWADEIWIVKESG